MAPQPHLLNHSETNTYNNKKKTKKKKQKKKTRR